MVVSALDLLDDVIAELEARLNLNPGEVVTVDDDDADSKEKKPKDPKQKANNNNKNKAHEKKTAPTAPPVDQPEICKLEFKVGCITKVWVHEKADKLYCEEIDVGEDTGPRRIASGLRPHFTEEQMLGQRLLVVSNLKAKNLVGFKSHGMVLCAAQTVDESTGAERVEFVEPPPGAPIGEVVTFQGLPAPQPFSAAQVEKKKVFAACLEGMRTTEDCLAAWNGHVFMTSAGPCRTKTISGGPMR